MLFMARVTTIFDFKIKAYAIKKNTHTRTHPRTAFTAQRQPNDRGRNLRRRASSSDRLIKGRMSNGSSLVL